MLFGQSVEKATSREVHLIKMELKWDEMRWERYNNSHWYNIKHFSVILKNQDQDQDQDQDETEYKHQNIDANSKQNEEQQLEEH